MRALPAYVLALWTLFVWGVRIRNADGAVGATVLSLTFVVLALLVLATRGHGLPTVLLGGWTVLVWAIRIVDIVALSDHDGAFKIVHTVLGLVSIALAGWADEHLSGRWRARRARVSGASQG